MCMNETTLLDTMKKQLVAITNIAINILTQNILPNQLKGNTNY